MSDMSDQEIIAAAREGFILLKEAALARYRDAVKELETVSDEHRWENSSRLWEEYNESVEDLRRFQ